MLPSGFFIVATQNPISFEGRQNLSDPLEKSIQRIVLPGYPNDELIEILITKGLQKKQAIDLVNHYNDNRKQAASCQNVPLTPSYLFS
jgi:MoxR-like ATPase